MKFIASFLSCVFGLLACVFLTEPIQRLFGLIDPIDIPIVLEGTEEYFDAQAYVVGQEIGAPLLAILFISLFAICLRWRHKLGKKKKDTLNINDIKGPFVLYLRSFKDDAITRKSFSFYDIRNEEEVLVEVVSDIAPVYAIGDPSDKKMPLGASRIYVDDAHWKQVVTEMMNRAVVVVLRLGGTESFWWEVETALDSIPVNKLLFVVPRSKSFNNVSVLYKILLEHHIDIKDLNVVVEKKRRGSISSFLYFDKEDIPVTTEVSFPRFTRLLLSYENILRNALSGFLSKFGLSTRRRMTVRLARISQLVLIVSLLFIGTSQLVNDYLSLKYQMPYELVERCVADPAFVSKYSDEVNGNNLVWSLIESIYGSFSLDDEDYLQLQRIKLRTIASMSLGELNHAEEKPKNLMLMVKKYCPGDYDLYVSLLAKAAKYSLYHPDEAKARVRFYQSYEVEIPQWMMDLAANETLSDEERIAVVISHFDDEGLADILKVLDAQGIIVSD